MFLKKINSQIKIILKFLKRNQFNNLILMDNNLFLPILIMDKIISMSIKLKTLLIVEMLVEVTNIWVS